MPFPVPCRIRTRLTPNKMADALRKCGGTLVCDGCPYQGIETPTCMQQMQQDAAALIEGMQGVIEKQADTISKIRTFVRSSK